MDEHPRASVMHLSEVGFRNQRVRDAHPRTARIAGCGALMLPGALSREALVFEKNGVVEK